MNLFYFIQAKTLLKNISFAATDPDDNDVISFSLTSVSDNLALKRFSIDPNSGAVRFAVDYEVDNGAMAETVVLYVNAHDSSHLMDTALVIIHVSDINDNAPSFSQDSYTIFVPLGQPMKTSILNLTATDPDQGLGGLRRIYESKTLNSPYFDIAMETRDAMNVSVYVSKELDVNDTQIMAVVATDGYGLEGTASVTISILGSVTYTYSLSEGLGTQHSNQQNCCCTDVQKLTWMIPFLVIMCTLLLAILIIITR
ncbi:hypothetical protein FSP39_010108 [Pinctada imbricata]|uniref:Cadherin domain-containing protein n=1 Tax=Pinctada imbricata TaxID=66713 RepID=A0AA89BUD8_PINIB|nr:hypothetical protein FSP39_010108 [Pinctada imbricata]